MALKVGKCDVWAVTIDDFFVELQREIDRGVDKIIFAFDPTYHFPTRVSIDRKRNQATQAGARVRSTGNSVAAIQ